MRIPSAALLSATLSLVLSAQGTAPKTAAALAALGPQVGQRVAAFQLVDQNGRTRTLQSVLGAKGGLLVFFRSAEW